MEKMKIDVEERENWTETISPKKGLFEFNWSEIWAYRDLLILLIKRDFIATYKQTILGPIWFFIQPLLTTLIFMLVFGIIAGISTNGIPMLVFYLSGITIWNYFAECLNKTATVFKDNASIFGKVYFPRLIMPLSIIASNLIRFGIQFILFIIVWGYYLIVRKGMNPNVGLLLVPYLIVLMASFSLGFGMIISALTTKYRDLIFLLGFGIQLLMYATPVIYSMQHLPANVGWLIKINPLSPIVETFRYAFTGSGFFSWHYLAYSSMFSILALMIGIIIFNKVEKSFMDTV